MNLRQYIPRSAWNDLVSSGHRRLFTPKAPLMHQGATPDCAIVLIEGTAKVTETTRAGEEVPLALRGRGDLLGETGLLFHQPREATVWASTKCVGLSIPASTFQLLVKRHDLSHDLYRFALTRSREDKEHLHSFRCDSTEVRTARLFAHFARKVGKRTERGAIFHMGMTSSEVSRMLGIGRTKYFESLKSLQMRKLIEQDNKVMRVPNLDRLDFFITGEIPM